jgi:hypothetical protein
LPEAHKRGFIITHDDSGIGAADEPATHFKLGVVADVFHAELLCFETHDLPPYGMKNTMKSISYQVKLTPGQIKAARGLIGWSAEELAQATALGITTIRRAELAEAETTLTVANDLAVRRALETAGVEFIDQNGGGPGVRLRNRSPTKY